MSQVLSVGDNRLTETPESLTLLTTLRILILSRNQLKGLPRTAHLPSLTSLGARHNRLRGLHVSLSPALKRVDLSHNQIETMT